MKRKSSTVLIAVLVGVTISFAGPAAAQQYYLFKFQCDQVGGMRWESEWMDERVSNTVTIDEQVARSCTSVHLKLVPVRPASRFDQDDEEAMERTRLWRQWAPAGALDDYDVISWTSGSARRPDDVWTNWSAGDYYRKLSWIHTWPDNFWFVMYFIEAHEREDAPKRFRARVEYVDGSGHRHNFFAVPWAWTERLARPR